VFTRWNVVTDVKIENGVLTWTDSAPGSYIIQVSFNDGKENVIIFGDYLRNGDTTSCGCIQSKNESKISQMLDLSNINYIKQYSFPNLYSARTCDKLYFDFAVLNDD
jgi:hypothetical protein